MIHILAVDDEPAILHLISDALTRAGYHCTGARDGLEASRLIEEGSYDLVLLDVMLPEIDGFTLISYIQEYHIPVIFLTAVADIPSRVHGLHSGAEDYIIKPFDISELLARVEVVLRRYHKSFHLIHVLDLEIDTSARRVTKGGVPVELTYKEFELLLLLVRNKNIAMYKEILYEKVWQDAYETDTRTVDLHIYRLRKKLGLEQHIQTIYKIGYMFKEQL